jgi:Cof subfamily protein (haloacid dehalogenase superfamily)
MADRTVDLIALDLDGTLIGPELTIAPRVRAAVRAAQARGIAVTLATGRSFAGAREFADQLAIRAPLLLYQGALVAERDSGRPLHAVMLPRALAQEAVALARARGWHVVLYDPADAYLERFELAPDFYAAMIHPRVTLVPDLLAVPVERFAKFLIIAAPEAIPAIAGELRARFAGRAEIVRSHPQFIEGNPPGVSKAAGLAWLAEYLGVARAAVLAVGDADNDAPMLQWAGVGVAMGNATPAARAAADWIAPPLEADGAAVAIERFALDGAGGPR